MTPYETIGFGLSILAILLPFIIYSMKSIKSDLQQMDMENRLRFNRVFEKSDRLVERVTEVEVEAYKEFVTKDECSRKHLK